LWALIIEGTWLSQQLLSSPSQEFDVNGTALHVRVSMATGTMPYAVQGWVFCVMFLRFGGLLQCSLWWFTTQHHV
jgi:hypothetical protein